MDIKQMIYFKTIVEQGTISKAAKVLHIAQPPLSIQLKQLENELDVQLLKRGHRNIELTEAGKLFYKRCMQMISLHELTINEMKNIERKIIRIGITSSNSSLIQNKKISDFFKQYPQYSFQITEGTTYELLDSLLSHNIDIGIVRTPFNNNQINALYLNKEEMYAVGTNEYLNETMKTIEDYKDIPLLIHRRYTPLITDYCLNKHFNPFIKCQSDDCRTSLIWATTGLGVAIVPKSALPLINSHELLKVPLINKELYTSIAIIYRKEEISSITKDFINILSNE
jgi:DNA-binding transcriptional LysR family regulator